MGGFQPGRESLNGRQSQENMPCRARARRSYRCRPMPQSGRFQPSTVFAVTRDISQHKQYEAQLLRTRGEAEEAIVQFLRSKFVGEEGKNHKISIKNNIFYTNATFAYRDYHMGSAVSYEMDNNILDSSWNYEFDDTIYNDLSEWMDTGNDQNSITPIIKPNPNNIHLFR